MAHSFIARADGRLMCRLEAEERSVLAQVAGEITDLIRVDLGIGDQGLDDRDPREAMSEDPLARLEAETVRARTEAPRDSATKRLFPSASDNDEDAGEYRRLTQANLAETHIANLSALRASLEAAGDIGGEGPHDEIVIERADALAWLKALNLIRLVLADRMGIENDGDFEALQLLCSNDLEEVEAEPGVAGMEFLATLYEFASWLQATLIGALNSRS
ncbi:DUF2017 domain-containing protein [Dermabacter vaginalis]|uniref:DUF2017 family protein n=1 Tax=Dermabacter vaginalis TaxID=1630135 RepID=A0ABX6A4N7_9MICO|nr:MULTISPECIES: DUF2017 family protein [Dermabacter]MCT2149538.1 DUF2017 domain-containing protein [Dermabacter vaginalis]QEU11574.1 DUF2017 family protein [Dermabacter vaginalis]RUP87477.1 DUF2017 family protein [Dermabacter sp. HSID17554]